MSETRRPAVLVLSTLHQFHPEVSGYGFAALRHLLEMIEPDAIFAEVTAGDLASRGEEGVKREYSESVYPFLKDFPMVRAHPLEPSGALRDTLICSQRRAMAQAKESPDYAVLESFVQSWLTVLLSSFRTAQDVNSKETDAAVMAKKEYEGRFYPVEYTNVWMEWNQHFYDRIVETVCHEKPRLSVVLVGLEHSYWLRAKLAACGDIDMLDVHSELERLDAASFIKPSDRV